MPETESDSERHNEFKVDPTEKIEEVETGYRMRIKSTRGSGTRDSDEVRLTAKTETLEELRQQTPQLHGLVTTVMNNRRAHQPDDTEEE